VGEDCSLNFGVAEEFSSALAAGEVAGEGEMVGAEGGVCEAGLGPEGHAEECPGSIGEADGMAEVGVAHGKVLGLEWSDCVV